MTMIAIMTTSTTKMMIPSLASIGDKEYKYSWLLEIEKDVEWYQYESKTPLRMYKKL